MKDDEKIGMIGCGGRIDPTVCAYLQKADMKYRADREENQITANTLQISHRNTLM
jgi:hypothetical protein